MKKGKLFLGYVAILIAAMIMVFPTEIFQSDELIVKAISATEAPSKATLFWQNISYFGAWAFKSLAFNALVYLALIGWKIQCVRWNAKKK